MTDRALIIGGPGTLSAHTISDLSKRGYQVAVLARNGSLFGELDPAVKTYRADRDRPSELAAALDDFKPDVVLDFVCYNPAQAEPVARLVSGKVRQFIFVSTVDVYGYPLSHLPLREDDPWHPETQSEYAANKRLCEAVFRSQAGPQLPLTIARPAYSFGPRFILTFSSRAYGVSMLRRLKTGRPVLIPGDGTTIMHASSARNTGKMISALVDAPQAIGKDYTCGHPTFTTHEGYVRLFADALGVTPCPVYIPTQAITAFPEEEARTCLLHALTRFNVAFSMERFLRDFPEFQWETSLADWTRYVVDWNEQHGLLDGPDDEIFDDRVIAAWQRLNPRWW